MPNSVETVIVILFIAGLLIYVFIEDQRLDAVIETQQQELELVSDELQQTIDRILADQKAGKITYEEASELMSEASAVANEKNLRVLEDTLGEIVPEN